MSDVIDINGIKEYLPHRYPFLLVDRILDLELNKSVVGIKNVSVNEEFFNGHFPMQPVMPGVLIIEAMAQTSGVLILKSLGVECTPENYVLLAGVDKARFKRMVVPGDQLKMEIEVLVAKSRIWKLKGTATVDGELACEAEFMCIKGS